jgi:type I restriction enzyme, S subunit
MKSYPQYKESGMEIIQQIPSHWGMAPLKFIGKIILGKMLTPEDKGGYTEKPYLRAKNIGWETVDAEDIKTMWFSPYELGQYRLEQNDLLISEGGEVGRTAIWNSELDECYIQNSVHKVTINQEHDPRYYLYHSQVFGKTGYYDSIINRVSIGHLTGEKLKDVRFAVPPLPEQQTITQFLDCKTAQIDTLIEKKQRQIDLLQEQRTARLYHVITKGLNPNAPMKASGVDWLGEIPRHWEVKQMRHCANIDYGISLALEKGVTNEVPILTLRNITFEGNFDLSNVSSISRDEMKSDDLFLKEGDLLFNWRNGSSSHIGKTAYFDLDGQYTFVSFLLRLRTNSSMDARFLQTYLNALRSAGFFAASKEKVNRTFNASELGRLSVLIPPLAEQAEIKSYLETEVPKINNLIDLLQQHIEFMQEYRTALISEAVTGKIDVR